MASLRSTAYAQPGQAGATQTPFAVGPVGTGGMDFGGLLSRQMALRDQMARLQMEQMRQSMRHSEAGFQRQRNLWQRRPEFSLGSSKPSMDWANAQAMAGALTGPRDLGFNPFQQQQLAGQIMALGPQRAQMGMMQAGQHFARPGGAAVPATAAGAMVEEMQETPGTPMAAPSPWRFYPGAGMARGRNLAEGGRVPSTGTYKLHKDEVVVPKKAADVLFPYVAKGEEEKKPKYKAKGKYPPDYELRFRARKGKVKGDYQEGSLTERQEREIEEYARYQAVMRPSAGYTGGGYGNLPFQYDVGGALQRAQGDPLAPPASVLGMTPLSQLSMPQIPLPDPSQMAGGFPGETPPDMPGVELGAPVDMPSAAPSSGHIMMGDKRYNLTDWHKNLPEASKMAEFQTAADIAKRGADLAASRADVLHEYQDQQTTPSPELDAKIKQWDRSRQRYEKRASDFQTRADTIRAQEIARDIQMIETQGQLAVEQMKRMGEAGEAQAEQLTITQKAVSDAFREAAKVEEPEQKAAILIGGLTPFLTRAASTTGLSVEDMRATLAIAIQQFLTGEEGAEGPLMDYIALISGERLGGGQ